MITGQLHGLLDIIDNVSPSQERQALLTIKGNLISVIEHAEAMEQELAELKLENADLKDRETVIIQGLEDKVTKSKVTSAALKTLIKIHEYFNPVPKFLTAKLLSSVTNSNESFVMHQLLSLHKENYIFLEDIDFDRSGPYIHMMPKGTGWLIENGYIKEEN